MYIRPADIWLAERNIAGKAFKVYSANRLFYADGSSQYLYSFIDPESELMWTCAESNIDEVIE